MIAIQFYLTTGIVGGSLTVRLVRPPVLERSHPLVSSLKGSLEETRENYRTVHAASCKHSTAGEQIPANFSTGAYSSNYIPTVPDFPTIR